MALKNNQDFQEFLKEQNPSDALLAKIETNLASEINHGFNMMQKAFKIAIQKVKDDAASARLESDGLENQEPFMTATKTNRGKRNIRSAVQRDPDTATKSAPATQLSKHVKPARTKGPVAQEVAATTATNGTVTNAGDIPAGTIRIEVFAGPSGHSHHTGLVRFVIPLPPSASQSTHCKIGRSTAKNFTEYGISLFKDLEVSTKHGVIHRIKKDYYYKDVGSSNGTIDIANDKKLEKLAPFKLENGTKLQMGQNILLFNFSS